MRRTSGTAVALPVALLAIALLVPLLVARHMQGGHTRVNVARSVRGAIVADVARAAVAEAWWQLETAAANSADPLYMTLRGGATTASSFTVDVPHLTRFLAEDPSMQGYVLVDGKVKVTVGARQPTSVRTREGIMDVKVEARAQHTVSGIARTVRETREMRLVLAALPPPFDLPSVIVLDAYPLVGDQTNAWMEEAVSTITQIANGIKGAGIATQGEIPPPLTDDLDRPIYRFPSKYVVRSTADKVPDLTRLFLWPRIEAAHRKIEALGPAEGLAGSAASDPQGTLRKAGEICRAHSALLQEAKEFQTLFSAQGGRDADLTNALGGQLAPGEWRRRALLTFAGAGAPQRFLDTLDDYAREETPRPVSGVVYVDNRDEPLKLKNRTFRGRLVIVATGAVEVDDVKVGNAQYDLLAIQAEGPLTARGRVESSLVAHGGVQLSGDLSLAGSLVVDHVRGGDRYGGAIDLDFNRVHTQTGGMDRPEFYRVAFAPLATSREMVE